MVKHSIKSNLQITIKVQHHKKLSKLTLSCTTIGEYLNHRDRGPSRLICVAASQNKGSGQNI